MPPFGPLYHQPVVVDKSLTSDPEISFNGGSHSDAIRMRYRDFEELVQPMVADFGAPMRGV
jgi:Ala-tRNA(Pro) deacylase